MKEEPQAGLEFGTSRLTWEFAHVQSPQILAAQTLQSSVGDFKDTNLIPWGNFVREEPLFSRLKLGARDSEVELLIQGHTAKAGLEPAPQLPTCVHPPFGDPVGFASLGGHRAPLLVPTQTSACSGGPLLTFRSQSRGFASVFQQGNGVGVPTCLPGREGQGRKQHQPLTFQSVSKL